MPFKAGNQHGKANLGRKKDHAKTLWLLESLNEKGFDFETKLVTLLEKAIKGDRVALEAAHLLVKLLPHVSNAPKQDVGTTQIETLVINRYELTDRSPTPEGMPSIVKNDAGTLPDGHSPVDAEIVSDMSPTLGAKTPFVNEPSQSEDK
jgi:hypothetical protein